MNRSTTHPIRAAIIGTGTIAGEHAAAMDQLRSRISLVSASDIDAGRLELFRRKFKIPHGTTNPEELIRDQSIELIVVATPPSLHEQYVIAGLQNGKFVLCEKPLAHTLGSARNICQVAERFPGRLAVGYQMRHSLAFQRLQWLSKNGIGSLKSARLERHSYIPHLEHGKTGWWGKWEVAGGGVVITQMIHEFDLLISLFGPPISVEASIDTRFTEIESEDTFEASVTFTNGRIAICRGSVNSGTPKGCFEIQGSLGIVGLSGTLTLNNPDQEQSALSKLNRALPHTKVPQQTFVSRLVNHAKRKLHIEAAPYTPHLGFYKALTESISQGGPIPSPPEETSASLDLCMGIYESAITSHRVELPLREDSRVFKGITSELYGTRRRVQSPTKNNWKNSNTALSRMKNKTYRIGLLGLDTSHASTISGLINDPYNPLFIPGAEVVGAYPGGSPDMAISASRVDGFTNELRNNLRIPIFDDPVRVAEQSDLIFMTAADGRVHFDLLKRIAPLKKPTFIDKPFAISVEQAEKMLDCAAVHGVRLFASSAFRYADPLVDFIVEARTNQERILEAEIHCWLPIEETQGRYFWYGIHAAEMSQALFGVGARTVSASGNGDTDKIIVEYGSDRRSTIIGSRTDHRFWLQVRTDKRNIRIDLETAMHSLTARLACAALDTLTDGTFPSLWRHTTEGSVSGPRASKSIDPSLGETLEVVRILEAAGNSYAQGKSISVVEPKKVAKYVCN